VVGVGRVSILVSLLYLGLCIVTAGLYISMNAYRSARLHVRGRIQYDTGAPEHQ